MHSSSAPSDLKRPSILLASVFGLGYLPRAPGTWGTLGALPLWYVFSGLSWSLALACTALLTVFAVKVSSRAEGVYGGHDNQHIVIDEVVGLLWGVIGVPWTPATLPLAFISFRLFDALKPGPVGWVDTNVSGGLGVVLDDVVAGLMTLLTMWGLFLALGRWP